MEYPYPGLGNLGLVSMSTLKWYNGNFAVNQPKEATMSWNHGTYGWEKYESFVQALDVLGIAYTEEFKDEEYSRGSDLYGDGPQKLRIARFTDTSERNMVCEEYLSVQDCDCDGSSQVAIAVYEQGQQPELMTEVREA